MSEELFTTQMRKATRQAHAVSDALVNAKLLFALNNNDVWAEGLLIFYEIFKFLENAMRTKPNENLRKLNLKEMNRTQAFEKDLEYYLGRDWKKNYVIRDSVKKYIEHLDYLSQTDSDLLMAYIYHLYMGLLSGGQILKKKREIQSKLLNHSELGNAVTKFNENIFSLKSQLKSIMNTIAEELDENKKAQLLEESVKVFELNNSIIKTVKGAERVAVQNLTIFAFFIVLIISVIFYFI